MTGARAAAAGWSPCDQARTSADEGRADASSDRPSAAAAGVGVHDQAELVVDQQREAVVAHPGADPLRMVAQRQQRRLVERGDAVGRLGSLREPADLVEDSTVPA